MFVEILQAQPKGVVGLAEKYGASDVRVFGSVARGEESENSHVDILVTLPRGYDMFS